MICARPALSSRHPKAPAPGRQGHLQRLLLLGFIFTLGFTLASECAHSRDPGLTPSFEDAEIPETTKDAHRDSPLAAYVAIATDSGERPVEHTSALLGAQSLGHPHHRPPARAPPSVRSANV